MRISIDECIGLRHDDDDFDFTVQSYHKYVPFVHKSVYNPFIGAKLALDQNSVGLGFAMRIRKPAFICTCTIIDTLATSAGNGDRMFAL